MLDYKTIAARARSTSKNLDDECSDPSRNTPSRIFARDADENAPGREQVPVDLIDEESMESFPCSDPPSYSRSHV